MGVTISAKNSPIEFDGGYGTFLRLRIKIALDYDKEFGEHYKNVTKCFDPTYCKWFDAQTTKILSDKRFKDEDVDVIKFFFMPDEGGKINYKTCKKILDIIKDDNEEALLRYKDYSEGHDWADFKELLQYCYSHRANMYWH